MCTAIHLEKEGVFGRTLDFERGFGESLIITPREHMKIGEAKNRYAIIGTGVEREGSALYFDGMNEWGLCGAALNFEGYAFYHGIDGKKTGLPSALLLSFMLGFCKEINEIKDTMKKLGITADSVFGFPATPLHWIFADRMGTIVIESTRDSVRVFDNPFGVLTNAPELDYHLTKASDYMSLHPGDLENKLSKAPLPKYSRGMGAIGLPGDFSSSSRFVRALFLRQNTLSYGNSIHKMLRFEADELPGSHPNL